MAEQWTPDEIQSQAEAYTRDMINNHSHRVRGGEPWFPASRPHRGAVPHRGIGGTLVEDLSAARGDGLSFGEDVRQHGKPITQVYFVNSLPYGAEKVGDNSWNYKRLTAIFAGRSMRGRLMALCQMREHGTHDTISEETYQLNEGVVFTPGNVSTFTRRGSVQPLDLDIDETPAWIEDFVGRQLTDLESVSPELDGFDMRAGSAFMKTSKNVGIKALVGAGKFLFGSPDGGVSRPEHQ